MPGIKINVYWPDRANGRGDGHEPRRRSPESEVIDIVHVGRHESGLRRREGEVNFASENDSGQVRYLEPVVYERSEFY